MRLLATVMAVMALGSQSQADSKLPAGVTAKDVALVERLFSALDQLAEGIEIAGGNCPRLAKVLGATAPGDNQVTVELTRRMEAADADALQKFTRKKYAYRLQETRRKVEAGTSGCRGEAGVAAAWKANGLAIGTWGELPLDPVRKVPRPAGYDAKLAKLDAALGKYRTLSRTFETI